MRAARTLLRRTNTFSTARFDPVKAETASPDLTRAEKQRADNAKLRVMHRSPALPTDVKLDQQELVDWDRTLRRSENVEKTYADRANLLGARARKASRMLEKEEKYAKNDLRPKFLYESGKEIHFTNTWFLSRFVSVGGKIMPRKWTGLNGKAHRKVAKAIKRARNVGLLPVLSKYAPSIDAELPSQTVPNHLGNDELNARRGAHNINHIRRLKMGEYRALVDATTGVSLKYRTPKRFHGDLQDERDKTYDDLRTGLPRAMLLGLEDKKRRVSKFAASMQRFLDGES